MKELMCPGLPAFMVNPWLAAVGATVLVPGLRLRWTAEASPVAVLAATDGDPVELLAESWPDRTLLEALPLAEDWRGAGSLKRRIPLEDLVERVRAARGHRRSWTLSSTVTDLVVDENGLVGHAPFDAAGPGTIKWLHHRLGRVNAAIEPGPEALKESLLGMPRRVKDNGLGFDLARLGSLADKTGGKWVDPVVEVLAFFGLRVFPVRGKGVDLRLLASRRAVRPRQRGWSGGPGEGAPLSFVWPAWTQELDWPGIDALLDVWEPDRKSTWRSLGVRAGWRTVEYRSRDPRDRTRAFGAERL